MPFCKIWNGWKTSTVLSIDDNGNTVQKFYRMIVRHNNIVLFTSIFYSIIFIYIYFIFYKNKINTLNNFLSTCWWPKIRLKSSKFQKTSRSWNHVLYGNTIGHCTVFPFKDTSCNAARMISRVVLFFFQTVQTSKNFNFITSLQSFKVQTLPTSCLMSCRMIEAVPS